MRGFMFKPIPIPGFHHSKPHKRRSLRFKLIALLFAVALIFAVLAGVYVTTYVVTFIWMVTTEPRPKTVEDLPLWTIPICMLSPILVILGIAWRFRLGERFALFLREEDERDAESTIRQQVRGSP